ncbi:MAG: Smr/MutS family protein, partial [Prevotellaceae bacterium]|nr:Smr/MutS family protein [Prevotellaceae bacterium]
MIYPATFEQKLGFDKIRKLVESKCATLHAKELLTDIPFYTNFEVLNQQLELTAEMQVICANETSFPNTGYVDVLNFIGKVKITGAYLDEGELQLLQQALHTVSGIVTFFRNNQADSSADKRHYPQLATLVEQVQLLKPVEERTEKIIDKFGKVKDNASPELQQIRRKIPEKQQQVTRRMQQILKAAQAAGYVDEDANVNLRDGRATIPVNGGSKRKLPGIILDESTTGKTAFIEPAEVVELNNEIKELGFAERREIIKILINFTTFLSPHLPDIILSAELLGTIDFIRAKALVANSISAVKPVLFNEQIINWRNARHPILEASLKKEGKPIVPLDLHLTQNRHILLISGPNAGGKSVCLKTAGLLQYMLQCGFPIPVSESSEAGIFENIFIDIGDEQSLENDLSTYSSHLQNMKYFLRNANSKTLILIDEFGTGTEPQAGGAIAESVLQSLLECKTFGIITTHYANLKQFATTAEGILNGAMLFDVQKIEPLFKLEVGTPGSSFAFEIAQKIGLPQELLTNAKEKLGENLVNFDKSLRDIARNRKYWEDKRNRIKNTDKILEEQLTKYQTELQQIQAERKRIISEAKDQAKKLLSDANREIENTVRSIKEAQAEKEKTRIARKSLQDFTNNIDSPNEDGEWIDHKIIKLKEQERKRAERKAKRKKNTETPAAEKEAQKPNYKVGDQVRILQQNVAGEIVKINDNGTFIIGVGNILTTLPVNRITHVSKTELKKIQQGSQKTSSSGTSLSVKRLNFKPQIDIRGMRADEALEEVQDFIDQALMYSVYEVKILHGKGTGVLKEQVRRYLKNIPGVTSVSD